MPGTVPNVVGRMCGGVPLLLNDGVPIQTYEKSYLVADSAVAKITRVVAHKLATLLVAIRISINELAVC